jgi:hypothetical protein
VNDTQGSAQTGTWINTSADRPRVECLRCGVVLTPGERFLRTCVAGRTPTMHLVATEAGVTEVTP